MGDKKNKFIIVSPFYNVDKWIKYCIRSVKAQKYSNYHCYLINDISTDNSKNIIEQEIKNDDKFTLINNTVKKYALLNIYDTLTSHNIDDEDIIVMLDGDDWLASQNVFSKLNDIYNKEQCLMTYGSYVEYPSKLRGKFAKKIPDHIVKDNSYRQQEWMSSHLRTFKYKVWKQIKKEDFICAITNEFYKAAWDLAFVFPLLELAAGKAHYVDDILYVYNRQNPLNQDKVNHQAQLTEEREIRNKAKYKTFKET